MTRPHPVLVAAATAAITLCAIFLLRRPITPAPAPAAATTALGPAADDTSPTQLYAHNILLRKGPNFRIYIRWIRGQILRTHKQVTPSFDDSNSFVLEIQKGILHANIGDISSFLNISSPRNAPLTNISIQPIGGQLQLSGTVHKIIPIPISLTGTLAPTPGGQVDFHLTKLDVLKIPLKGLLGGLHLQLSDLVSSTSLPGVTVQDNDILFNTEQLLPPPHIHGAITSIRVLPPDLEVIYGNAGADESQLAQWHNFLRLTGGTLDFGKLTMHHVDLTMIDASQSAWFDLDLVNYQSQIVNGTTRMTAQAGLEIYMPPPSAQKLTQAGPAITLEWLKNRNTSPPPDVQVK